MTPIPARIRAVLVARLEAIRQGGLCHATGHRVVQEPALAFNRYAALWLQEAQPETEVLERRPLIENRFEGGGGARFRRAS